MSQDQLTQQDSEDLESLLGSLYPKIDYASCRFLRPHLQLTFSFLLAYALWYMQLLCLSRIVSHNAR